MGGKGAEKKIKETGSEGEKAPSRRVIQIKSSATNAASNKTKGLR